MRHIVCGMESQRDSMRKSVTVKKKDQLVFFVLGVCLVALAGCMSSPKKVVLSPTQAPAVKQAEVALSPSQPALPPGAPTEETKKLPALSAAPVLAVPEPPPEPRIVVQEKLVLPARGMYMVRSRYYARLAEKYQTLSDYLDWFGQEEGAPELKNCLEQIAGIEEGYETGKELLENSTPVEGTLEQVQPWQVVWRDISFIQGECQSVYKAKSAALVKLLDEFNSFQAGQPGNGGETSPPAGDETVISSYRYLLDNFPQYKKNASFMTQYGRALLKNGRLQGAGDAFLQALDQNDETSGNLALRRTAADLLLITGRKEQALKQYEILAEIEQAAAAGKQITAADISLLKSGSESEPLLRLYQSFLQEYYTLGKAKISVKARTAVNQLESFYPENPLTEHARTLLAGMEKSEHKTVEEQLAAVDRMADEKEYDQAKKVLNELQQQNLDPELAASVRYKLQEITFDAAEEQKTQEWQEREQLAGRWQQAQDFFDRHQYDAAIEAYSTFAGTVYETEAASQTQKAIDEAAGGLRRQAATLFLKARKENDTAARIGYLRESLALLQQVEQKYPQTEIYDKVQRNMEVLEKEIAALTPPPEQGQ